MYATDRCPEHYKHYRSASDKDGYLVREQQTDNKGNFKDVLYKFSDEPIFLQKTESPSEDPADTSDKTDVNCDTDDSDNSDNTGFSPIIKDPSADAAISEKPAYNNKNSNKRQIYKSTTKEIMCCKAATDAAAEKKQTASGSPSTEMMSNKSDNTAAYTEIIEHLNKKAQTNYRPTTIATQYLIDYLLEEGFTIDDFKTVIDRKCAEWLGTNMAQYLRPQTLFGSKFESYLNTPPHNGNESWYGKKTAQDGPRDYSVSMIDLLNEYLDEK